MQGKCFGFESLKLWSFYASRSDLSSGTTVPNVRQLYSAAPVRDQAAGVVTQHRTHSYYPNTALVSSCPILLLQSARLTSDEYQFHKSFDLTNWKPCTLPTCPLYSGLKVKGLPQKKRKKRV